MTLDAFLYALRLAGTEYRLSPTPPPDAYERAYARCPVCRTEGCLTLELVERFPGSPIEIDCLMNCSEFQIRRALARDVHLSLAAQLDVAA